MRPSSGGSRRISKRLRPSCARETISTATPAIGTALSAAASSLIAAADHRVGVGREAETARLNGMIGGLLAGAGALGADAVMSARASVEGVRATLPGSADG